MDDGYEYIFKIFQKIFIVLRVKFWWIDEKWY
jgi:hypothetical protein